MAMEPAAISASPAVTTMWVEVNAPEMPAARANGTVKPSAIPITTSRTVSLPEKCCSMCFMRFGADKEDYGNHTARSRGILYRRKLLCFPSWEASLNRVESVQPGALHPWTRPRESYFLSISWVAPLPGLVAQQKAESSPHALQLCLSSVMSPLARPTTVQVELHPLHACVPISSLGCPCSFKSCAPFTPCFTRVTHTVLHLAQTIAMESPVLSAFRSCLDLISLT